MGCTERSEHHGHEEGVGSTSGRTSRRARCGIDRTAMVNSVMDGCARLTGARRFIRVPLRLGWR
jgi:hypothetical protein